MGNIISNEENSKHKIKKFSFQKLDINEEDLIDFPKNPFEDKEEEEERLAQEEADKKEKGPSQEEHEALLEKIDQLTSDIVQLQMEAEKREKEYEQQLQESKEQAFEEGKTEGMRLAQEEYANEHEELKSQLIQSIAKLDETTQTFEKTLQELEEELTQSALMLAKKIIVKEVDQNSALIATEIARSLLKTIDESSEVTIKVNPVDQEYISSQFNESRIKIAPDDAIHRGGVVIMSASGNIDGNIFTRYKQTVALLQKES